MSHHYRIEEINDGEFKVHFGEHTNFPFSITDEREDRAIERANIIVCQLRRQEREFYKKIGYVPTHAVLTAPKD